MVRNVSPVAVDSSTYHLLSQTPGDFETFAISGSVSFRNVTNRTLYLTDGCFGPAMHLERDNGERVPMYGPICLYDNPPPDPPPHRTPIAPGDSIVVPFSFSTELTGPRSDLGPITGAVRLVFDAEQLLLPAPQPEAISPELRSSQVFTIAQQ